jgi:hypothetical protein
MDGSGALVQLNIQQGTPNIQFWVVDVGRSTPVLPPPYHVPPFHPPHLVTHHALR